MYMMAFTLFRLTSIPFFDTMKPNRFPDVKLNMHFLGLSMMLYYNNISNSFSNRWKYYSRILYLARKSST